MEVVPSSPQAGPPSSAEAFSQLLAGLPQKKKSEAAKFVKRLKDIPKISLLPETPIQVALSLAERALIGQCTGLWPSPKTTETWVNKNWAPLIKRSVTSYFLGRGSFLFEFTSKDDKDLTFQNGPYFVGPQGVYLNRWMPDSLYGSNSLISQFIVGSLKHIGNALGKFIDRETAKNSTTMPVSA